MLFYFLMGINLMQTIPDQAALKKKKMVLLLGPKLRD